MFSQKTPTSLVIEAMITWGPPMFVPFFSMFLNKYLTFNVLNISVIYPIILSFASRNAKFWITRKSLLLMCISTLLVSFGLTRINKKSKEALKNPDAHLSLSIPLFLTIMAAFFISFFIVGMYIEPLFDLSNFS
jgi:hypothetical protein